MVAVSKILHSAANLPISSKEFFHAFASIWPPTTRSRHSDLLQVGLAISGGVDSMALAAICSELNHIDLESFGDIEHFSFGKRQRLSFHAFIVDHGARIGSDEEALLVSQNLEQIGIPAHILKLQWPNGCKPLELSNFESVARTLRYQALGKACYNHGVEPLLTAHHEDDQVETVIMRLLRGARSVNLQGIRSSTDIPECHGIYGVHRSGHSSFQLHQHDGQEEENYTQSIRSMQLLPIPMESGGVRLYRPLLSFSKSRLTATCVHLNTPWFEDKTNLNPTLTQRNAIRYLYQKNLMPEALSKPYILHLARKMQMKFDTEEALVKSMFSKTCIEEINLNAGTLKVRFPKMGSSADSEEVRSQKKMRLARFLRSLIYFVTPNENVVLSDLGTACEAVFPGLFPEQTVGLGKQLKSFTIAGVQFTRMASAISLPHKALSERWAERHIALDVWVLSRQAYKRSEKLPYISLSHQVMSPTRDSACLITKHWSSWHLFDGRFWIRISNMSSILVVIRPFRERDMAEFSAYPKLVYFATHGKKDISKEEFARLMKKKFPGAIRYTLPAIISMSEGREMVVALPTIGVATTDLRESGLDWEIRYKCVDDLVRSN